MVADVAVVALVVVVPLARVVAVVAVMGIAVRGGVVVVIGFVVVAESVVMVEHPAGVAGIGIGMGSKVGGVCRLQASKGFLSELSSSCPPLQRIRRQASSG